MDKKSIVNLLAEVARRHPEQYESVSKTIMDLGRKASYLQGETLTLSDMEPVMDREKLYQQMDNELETAKRQLSDTEYKKKRNEIWFKYSDLITKGTQENALSKGNNLGYSVVSGARGNANQLRMMLSTPGVYMDAKDEVVPVFVRRSFGDGLRPAEYLAGSYGARKAVLSTKRATAKGGDAGKQMVQSAVSLVVTEKDCGVKNGIDLSIDDTSLRGRVLAEDAGGLPAGTVLDRQALNQLRKKNVETVISRSALTCASESGVCAKCVGTNSVGKFYPIGESVGVTAAQALSEPLAQGALHAKHSGGAASGAKKTFSGLDVINTFTQSPEVFPDKSVLAMEDGVVSKIEEAPQGGSLIHIGDRVHYVPIGYPLVVKKGDVLEAGDQLSEGLIDPGEIVDLKGLGEGRRYYSERLKQLLDDSGSVADKRSTELVARAALNHIQVTDADEDDPYLPDDIISYSYLNKHYTPPEDTAKENVRKAVGKYLQMPVLHYTVGTRITPKVAAKLEGAKKNEVYASATEPRFKPIMMRLRTAAHVQKDWLANLHTSYLKKNLAESAIRGEDTNIEENIHFAPRVAVGEGFADNIGTTGKF